MNSAEDIKKFFLIALIGSLLVIAFTSILIFLFGSFNEVEVRILLTMVSISIASLLGIWFSKIKTDYVRTLGLAIIGIMFVITIGSIWEILDEEFFHKGLLISLILMALLIQSPWILKPQKDKTLYSIAVATFISASIVALMVLQIILDFINFNELYYRVLGVFGILYLLGLILNPILRKLIH